MENENINNEVKINKQELELLKESQEALFKLRFLVIPDWLYQEDLSGTALKILAFVISYKSDKFYFSTEHLCKMFNVNEIRIKRALKELKENGFIETKTIIKNGGGKIRFIILTEKTNYQKYNSELTNMNLQKYQKCSFRSIKNDHSEVSNMTHLIKDNKINDNNINTNTPYNPPKKGETDFNNQETNQSKQETKPNKVEVKLPDWLPVDVWNDFLEMRKKIKKPMTDKAKELLINKLDMLRKKGDSPKEVLEQSIMNSWQGVFALRKDFNNNGYNNNKRPSNMLPEKSEEEIDKEIEDMKKAGLYFGD